VLFFRPPLYSHSHTRGTNVCKPHSRVNCLWGAHYSAVIRQMLSTWPSLSRNSLGREEEMAKVAALANN